VSGYKTLAWIRSNPRLVNLPVICVTILDDRQALNRIFDSGATDYIGKPIRENELLARIRLHLKLHSQDREITEALAEVASIGQRFLTRKLEHTDAFTSIITRHPRMSAIFHYIEAVAPSSRPVLISGETGVGKELIAHALHEVSGRQGKFVVVNVAGLDDTLFSDTLFGHERGAFTGAIKDRRGLVRDADEGTLFLDEIGDLSTASQVKLLRLLQEREYYPLGSDVRQLSTARIVCATHADLEAEVEGGKYRSDLYYRLKTHHLQVPPLRQRKCDIPLLFHHFVNQAAAALGVPAPAITPELEKAVTNYQFPGNIRELEALCHDLVSRSTVELMGTESLLDALSPAASSGAVTLIEPEPEANEEDEISSMLGLDTIELPTIRQLTDLLVRKALERASGNQALAARYLGISRQALHKRLKKRAEGADTDGDDDE